MTQSCARIMYTNIIMHNIIIRIHNIDERGWERLGMGCQWLAGLVMKGGNNDWQQR